MLRKVKKAKKSGLNNKLNSLVVWLLLMAWLPAHAVIYATVEQTMQKIYAANCEIKKKNYFLSEANHERLVELLQVHKNQVDRTNLYFEETEKGKVVSRVFIDTHRVRTLKETILIKVNANNEVEHIEILAFNEPKDYLAKEVWLQQFKHKRFVMDKSLLKQEIKPYLGASLTASAIDKAVRKVLLMNQWMNQGQL